MCTQRRTIYLLILIFLSPGVWADDALTMGVFPRRSATLTSELFSPLADYLAKNLNRPVKLVTAKDFDTFWAGVKKNEYDIVHYNQYHYIQSADDYSVIVANEELGQSRIAGALYVRADSGITSIEQLRGANIIFGGGTDAMMSYIVPRYLLKEAGLDVEDYHPLFASNPLNAVLGVYFKQATAGGAGEVVMNLPRIRKTVPKGALRFLKISEQIEHLPWVVKNDMTPELRKRIRDIMVGLNESKKGKAILKAARLTGMHAVSDSDYDNARKIIKEVYPKENNNPD